MLEKKKIIMLEDSLELAQNGFVLDAFRNLAWSEHTS